MATSIKSAAIGVGTTPLLASLLNANLLYNETLDFLKTDKSSMAANIKPGRIPRVNYGNGKINRLIR
jgi:hypothetical protein